MLKHVQTCFDKETHILRGSRRVGDFFFFEGDSSVRCCWNTPQEAPDEGLETCLNRRQTLWDVKGRNLIVSQHVTWRRSQLWTPPTRGSTARGWSWPGLLTRVKAIATSNKKKKKKSLWRGESCNCLLKAFVSHRQCYNNSGPLKFTVFSSTVLTAPVYFRGKTIRNACILTDFRLETGETGDLAALYGFIITTVGFLFRWDLFSISTVLVSSGLPMSRH